MLLWLETMLGPEATAIVVTYLLGILITAICVAIERIARRAR